MAEFVKVATVGALPDDTGYVVEVDGKEIALFRSSEAVYAIDNECPHREGPLGEGYLSGEVVTCPFHAWEVNVRTGEVLDVPGLCTRTYRCRVEDGDILVEV